jgi:hypothetical protein
VVDDTEREWDGEGDETLATAMTSTPTIILGWQHPHTSITHIIQGSLEFPLVLGAAGAAVAGSVKVAGPAGDEAIDA